MAKQYSEEQIRKWVAEREQAEAKAQLQEKNATLTKNGFSSFLNAIAVITWILGLVGGIGLVFEYSVIIMIAVWVVMFLLGVVFLSAAQIISLLSGILNK